MAVNVQPTYNADLDWLFQSHANFEWTNWWAEVEPSSSTSFDPKTNVISPSTSFFAYADPNSLPIVSPASTSTSEPFTFENQSQPSDHDEVVNKAKRRKIQNREAQRKCRDRRREQVLNLGERLRNSLAENKNLQVQYAKLQEEYNRLKSENGVYFELLQSFWTGDAARKEVTSGTNDQTSELPLWSVNSE